MASERRLRGTAKKRRALELKITGLTYRQIADELDYRSPASAHAAVMRALRETLAEPAEELRQLEVGRLDALLEAVWADAMTGKLPAVDRVLRIGERRAKLLGLDLPPEPAEVDIWPLLEGWALANGGDVARMREVAMQVKRQYDIAVALQAAGHPVSLAALFASGREEGGT